MAAHQPLFLPYLGFFDKMRKADVFVIRDDVQFSRSNFHNRNRIRIDGVDEQGAPRSKWISVPVDKAEIPLGQVMLKNEVGRHRHSWDADLMNQLRGSYGRAPFFRELSPKLEKILASHPDRLLQLNLDLIEFFREVFAVSTRMVLATALTFEASGDPTVDLIRITRAVGADAYLSGTGARDYLRPELFEEASIPLHFQEFHHPVYPQLYPGFIPNLACVDAVLNVGAFPA